MFNIFKKKQTPENSVEDVELLISIMDADKALKDREMREQIDNYRREAYTQMMKDHYKFVVDTNRERLLKNQKLQEARLKEEAITEIKRIKREEREALLLDRITTMYTFVINTKNKIKSKYIEIRDTLKSYKLIMVEFFMEYIVRESLRSRAKRYSNKNTNSLDKLETIILSTPYTATLLDKEFTDMLITEELTHNGVSKYYVSSILENNINTLHKLYKVNEDLNFTTTYSVLTEIFDYLEKTSYVGWLNREKEFKTEQLLIAVLIIAKNNFDKD